MDADKAKNVLDYVEPDAVVRLLQSLIRIPSPAFEESQLAEFIADYLDRLGIEVRMVEVSDPLEPARRSKQPIGIIRGDGSGPSLMFNGHMDHNPLAGGIGDWARDPYSGDVDDTHVYGRGAIDEKGGIAGLLTAGEAIKNWGIRLKGDLLLCPVLGHKRGGIGTKHHLQNGLRADLCINTETTGLGIITTGVGAVRVHITFKGRPVHFTSPPQRKAKAAFPVRQAAQFITRLEPDVSSIQSGQWLTFEVDRELPGFPQLSVDGIESQSTPESYCRVIMQIRTVPGQTADTVRHDLEKLMTTFRSDVPNVEIDLEVPPPGEWDFPPYKISSNHMLPMTLARWHTFVTGEPANVGCGPRLGACGDANFLANEGIPTVQYGPGSIEEYEQWPAINERIKIDDLLTGAKAMTLTAAEICGE